MLKIMGKKIFTILPVPVYYCSYSVCFCVIGPCFVMATISECPFQSGNHLAERERDRERERDGCFTVIMFILMYSCLFCVFFFLSRGALRWSVVCDWHIFWS